MQLRVIIWNFISVNFCNPLYCLRNCRCRVAFYRQKIVIHNGLFCWHRKSHRFEFPHTNLISPGLTSGYFTCTYIYNYFLLSRSRLYFCILHLAFLVCFITFNVSFILFNIVNFVNWDLDYCHHDDVSRMILLAMSFYLVACLRTLHAWIY